MEEKASVHQDVPVLKAVDEAEVKTDIKVVNGRLALDSEEGRKDKDEGALDGEFIKVEKELLEIMEGSHPTGRDTSDHGNPALTLRSFGNSSHEMLETQEKMKETELELERVVESLKKTESENVKLKEEVLSAKERLEMSKKACEELESSHSELRGKIVEAEKKYDVQVGAFQEVSQAHEAKELKFAEVKEAIDGLQLELDGSHKRLVEFEKELASSTQEARKFEELHKQSGSVADSQTQKALEFERLLKVAKENAKEMESQMSALQDEIKGLYERIAEGSKAEEALLKIKEEYLNLQQELAVAKSKAVEFEEKHLSKESMISELQQELELLKASESQIRGEFAAVQDELGLTKYDHRAKIAELVELKTKLHEETIARETYERHIKTKEAEFFDLQETLANLTEEKEALGAAKELSAELESKLKASEDNFFEADSLLSQTLATNAELEDKRKSLEELHRASRAEAAIVAGKNLELESLIQASTAAAEDAKAQLAELEARYLAAEQKNVKLEQQLPLMLEKGDDAERELKELSDEISCANATIKELDGEKKQVEKLIVEYREKIASVEGSLSQSLSRNVELEEELKTLAVKCVEHEDRANVMHQRSLELEDIVQVSHSKTEDTGRMVVELELLLETEKSQIQELKDELSGLQKKLVEEEEDCNKFSTRASKLASELEAYQARSSSVEIALQTAEEKERELTECLDAAVEEKTRLENAVRSYSTKLGEAENLLELLKNDLSQMQSNLETLENDFQVVGIREVEALEKLKSAEEQIEEHVKLLEQTSKKHSELQLLHKSTTRDFDLKLQEVATNYADRDSEARSMTEKINFLEEKSRSYEAQLAKTSAKSASVRDELDQSMMRVSFLETMIQELQKQIDEAENKSSLSLSDNELLVATNAQLKSRVDELQELIDAAASEKEVMALQLVSHVNDLSELRGQHSRALELHSTVENRRTEAENQLEEAARILSQRDAEVADLKEKIVALEGQMRILEGKVVEASEISTKNKDELEETISKLKQLEGKVEEANAEFSRAQKENEGLAEVNLKLTEELAGYESKLNDTAVKLSTVLAKKDEAVKQHQSAKSELEELVTRVTEGAKALKSQINSLSIEQKALEEAHCSSQQEHHAAVLQLEEQLKDKQAGEDTLRVDIENLKTEVLEKSTLQNRIRELEEKVPPEGNGKEVAILASQVKDIEKKLQIAESKLIEKESTGIGGEVRSRDIGSPVTTPSKRKSKKKAEGSDITSAAATPWETARVQTAAEVSTLGTLKFILGVALISVIVGIILGKKYLLHVRLYVQNDAVAALASGTLGKLHGCVLIAGTGTIAYGFTGDGWEARAASAGPTLGDWSSGYGIDAQALTAVIRAYDGRGPNTNLTSSFLKNLILSSPDELIGWTYEDPSWARIAALVPLVVLCAEAGDDVANKILLNSVEELALTMKAVVQRLGLCGKDGKGPFPLVMVGGVLEANKKWGISKEVMSCISKDYPGAYPIRPKVETAVGAAMLAWNFLLK